MKLDKDDLVRDVLLQVEASPGPMGLIGRPSHPEASTS